MKNPFASSEGVTPTEKILARLANETFLEPWSYPNLYKKESDELCDLLVVFENSMIIFSDKSCAYPCTAKPELNWSRWYRRSIEKSAKQVRRAEGWLKRLPDRVYLDSKCTCHVPISIPAAGANGRGGSEDFVLVDTQHWATEDLHRAERMGAELGFFVGTSGRFVEDEYPTR